MRLRKTLQGLFGLSGGVGYHLAALVSRGKLWAPFRSQISAELSRILRSGSEPELSRLHLVVIGASGGYCLEPSFLASFGRVTAVDLDPLAQVIFRRRLSRELTFIRQDFFEALEGVEWNLERWLTQYAPTVPGTPLTPVFLFSNVLGQLGYLYSDLRFKQVSRGLAQALGASPISWLSYHDRLTVAGRARESVIRQTVRRPSEALAGDFLFGPAEVEEHELGEWIQCARGEFSYLSWRLNSARTQIIEVISSKG